MKTVSLLTATLLAATALSGCFGGADTGTLSLYLSDAPSDIGDFRFLNITVSEVNFKIKGQDDKTLTPSTTMFDLVTLQGANTSKLAEGEAPAGEIEKIDIAISKAEGILLNGTAVAIQVPSGRVFLLANDLGGKDAKVEKGQTTEFVFDVTVVKEGSGDYKLKPNASASGKKGSAATLGEGDEAANASDKGGKK